MKIRGLAAALAAAIFGSLTGCGGERLLVGDSDVSSTLICSVTADPKAFLGKRVLIRARYFDDGGSYNYLLDRKCSGNGLVDISNLRSKGDASVAAFIAARQRACVADGNTLLCTLEAQILVEATIVASRSGGVAIDLERVLDFELER